MQHTAAILEACIVAIIVAGAAGYAALVLMPASARRWLAARLGTRAPGWLLRRLAVGDGCGSCPANALHARAPRR